MSIQTTSETQGEGLLIKTAIGNFCADRTTKNLIVVMRTLVDNLIWIPCNAIMGSSDQQFFQELIDQSGDDLNSLVGKTFTSKEDIRLIPDILQKGDEYFFPVFSSIDEMGEYGEGFSKQQASFMYAVSMAKNNKKYRISGIVVNAFTNSIVLPWNILRIIETMTDSDTKEG